MFERFTGSARQVLVLAQEEARLLSHNFIGTEHILLGMLHEGTGAAAQALAAVGVGVEAVRMKVQELEGPTDSIIGSPPFTPRAKKVLELALREAVGLGHNDIGTEHLLLGLLREGNGVGHEILVSLGVDPAQLRSEVLLRVGTDPDAPVREAQVPPVCPRCRASLTDTATHQPLTVTNTAGEAPITVAVVYCRACGTALGINP